MFSHVGRGCFFPNFGRQILLFPKFAVFPAQHSDNSHYTYRDESAADKAVSPHKWDKNYVSRYASQMYKFAALSCPSKTSNCHEEQKYAESQPCHILNNYKVLGA